MNAKEWAKYASAFSKLGAFIANGLTDVDFVRCWVSWSILPLSRRLVLMCEYTGDLKDPQRHCDIQLSDTEIAEATKALLNESLIDYSKTGLSPFYTLNEPPAVSIAHLCSTKFSIIMPTYDLFILNRPILHSGRRSHKKNRTNGLIPKPRLPRGLPRISPSSLPI